METKILQLALEALENKKAVIEKEIAEIQTELKRSPAPQAKQSRSERMKAYWAVKRAGPVKIAEPTGKRRQKTAAEKAALSRKLKAAWARRKTAKS